jgi:hypothetical protein
MDISKMSMDIHAKPGTKIKFAFPNAGYEPDQELARKHLKVGKIYTVAYTSVHRNYTNVYLKEVPGVKFNSVLFNDV